MLIGFTRVSTSDQNLELQKEALLKIGCERIYKDKISGTIKERPGLNLISSLSLGVRIPKQTNLKNQLK